MNNKTHSKKWDLEEITAKFGENIIRFCQKIPKNPITFHKYLNLLKLVRESGFRFIWMKLIMRKVKKFLVIGFYLGQLGLGDGIKLFVVLIFGDINN